MRRDFLASVGEYPAERFSGRGIVIPGGGARYFTCAYVLIRRLRELGCTLPIELWHLGVFEMDQVMRDLVEPLNVKVVDAYTVRREHPIKNLNGWELNAYAVQNSAFEEVMLLDADNMALRDPSFLFDHSMYKEHGALFWPDYDFQRLKPQNAIWDVMEVPYRDEQAFESGQLLIDKKRSWRPLSLAVHFNSESDFYYKLVLGDKETFRFGWHCTGQPYKIISTPVFKLPASPLPSLCMCQHDPDGNRLFQHRNLDKLRLDGFNCYIPGFIDQDRMFELLEELRTKWTGKVTVPADTDEIRALRDELVNTSSWRWVTGPNVFKIKFTPEGKVLGGNQVTGNTFRLEDTGNGVTLATLDDFRLNSRLSRVEHKRFSGTKVHHGLNVELRGHDV